MAPPDPKSSLSTRVWSILKDDAPVQSKPGRAGAYTPEG